MKVVSDAPYGATARAVPGHRLPERPGLWAISVHSVAAAARQVLFSLRGMALAHLLGPTGLGLWHLFSLALAYLRQSAGPGLCALRQELPRALAVEDREAAESIRRTLLTASLLAVLCSVALCAILAGVWSQRWTELPGWVWGAAAVACPLTLLHAFQIARFQSEGRILLASGLALGSTACGAVGIAAGATWAGVGGAVAGLVAAESLVAGWLLLRKHWIMPCRLRWRELRSLWSVGMPIWVTGVPVMLLADLDRFLIALHLGTRELGLYALAISLGSLLRLAPGSYRVVYQPFLIRRLGATGDWQALEPYLSRSLLLVAYASPIAIVTLFFLVDPAVRWLLPDYVPGLPAVKAHLVASFWPMLAPVTHTICVAGRSTRGWFVNALAALVVHGLLTTLALRSDAGLLGVVVSTGSAYFLYFVLQVRTTSALFRISPREVFGLIVRLALPFVTCSMLLAALASWGASLTARAGAAAGALLPLLVGLALLGLQYRWADRRWRFADILRPAPGPLGVVAQPTLPLPRNVG